MNQTFARMQGYPGIFVWSRARWLMASIRAFGFVELRAPGSKCSVVAVPGCVSRSQWVSVNI